MSSCPHLAILKIEMFKFPFPACLGRVMNFKTIALLRIMENYGVWCKWNAGSHFQTYVVYLYMNVALVANDMLVCTRINKVFFAFVLIFSLFVFWKAWKHEYFVILFRIEFIVNLFRSCKSKELFFRQKVKTKVICVKIDVLHFDSNGQLLSSITYSITSSVDLHRCKLFPWFPFKGYSICNG